MPEVNKKVKFSITQTVIDSIAEKVKRATKLVFPNSILKGSATLDGDGKGNIEIDIDADKLNAAIDSRISETGGEGYDFQSTDTIDAYVDGIKQPKGE